MSKLQGFDVERPDVEMVKNLFPKVPTNFVAAALILTLVAVFILCAAVGIPIEWYYIAGAVVLGLFVGYAAMFRFDKFKAAWEKVKKAKE